MNTKQLLNCGTLAAGQTLLKEAVKLIAKAQGRIK